MTNVLEVSDLAFTYPGAPEATLQGLNLSIREGEIFGLLGPSGCGKSTTQNILMGQIGGYRGDIRIFDQDLATLGRDYYERIGVSFELPTLYLRLTARENLAFFASLYRSDCIDPIEALKSVDLQDAADQKVGDFSKGMKMRLNLCRAILHDPELLFFDEPTSGQDPSRARITRELILSLKAQGKTIFLTTHNMTEAAQICDRVGFLARGHIPVVGSPAELMRDYGEGVVEVTRKNGAGFETETFSKDGLGRNAAFLSALDDGFVSVHSKEATLEDVFVAVTGDAT